MTVEILVFSIKTRFIEADCRRGPEIVAVCPEAERKSITQVIDSCHRDGGSALAASGFIAELVGRPQREVMVWLARVHSMPAGVVTLVAAHSPVAVRHSIGWLLVSPAHRRAGVGSALAAAALGAARDRGASEVWVETRSDWVAAAAFWRALGFSAPRRREAAG